MSTWKADVAHSLVGFSVRHMMISRVRGQFNKFDIELQGDPSDLAGAKLQAKIETDSIDTREADRDNHLRSADFFEVERFPMISFESSKITPAGENEFDVEGNLTIRDVTRPVSMKLVHAGTMKDPWGNQRAVFNTSTKLNRRDFGLKWSAPLETGGVLVGDEVNIEIEAQLVQQSE